MVLQIQLVKAIEYSLNLFLSNLELYAFRVFSAIVVYGCKIRSLCIEK